MDMNRGGELAGPAFARSDVPGFVTVAPRIAGTPRGLAGRPTPHAACSGTPAIVTRSPQRSLGK